MAGDSAQDFLFQRIREMIPQHVSLVDAISELLSVSSDSAYRRIRGKRRWYSKKQDSFAIIFIFHWINCCRLIMIQHFFKIKQLIQKITPSTNF